jgi:TPR repeat protein
MYAEGRGMPQDLGEAVRWWRSAAEQGHVAAQLNLGLSLVLGRGITQNFVEAYAWLSLAAVRLPFGEARDFAIRECEAVRTQLTAAQIAEAQRRAREWDQAYQQAGR